LGFFLGVGAVSPAGKPMMIGATAENSSRMPSSAFVSGRFSAGIEEPITHGPSPIAQAGKQAVRYFSVADETDAASLR